MGAMEERRWTQPVVLEMDIETQKYLRKKLSGRSRKVEMSDTLSCPLGKVLTLRRDNTPRVTMSNAISLECDFLDNNAMPTAHLSRVGCQEIEIMHR